MGAGLSSGANVFCCQGCQAVFELLTANGLADFYAFNETAGSRIRSEPKEGQFKYLDEPTVRERLVDFTDERMTRATFHVPAIHCIACVWLLENLFRLKPGIGRSEVSFARKDISITFDTGRVKLSEIVALLASLGYEPELKFSDLDGRRQKPLSRRLWLQLGIAGFAFGNIMLLSIPSYLGLDSLEGPAFRRLFGYLSLALSLPIILFSAADYWRSAWTGFRERVLTIDVPIAAGITALFVQSVCEVVSGTGAGYFDSLAGLLFFLLVGKVFQQKAYARLAFDRDYKSFFPLAVTRLRKSGIRNPKSDIAGERVTLAQLEVGDRLVIRNGELIPADARLVEGSASIDYSFVTGEAEPVEKKSGDHLYAGGRQIGGAIEVEVVKPVSHSYLTSLWNQDAFLKKNTASLNTLTNRYSRNFTKAVLAIAVGAAVFWAFRDPDRSLKSFVSVLIVACPCALALAAPFALGTAQRVLGRRNVFLKDPSVVETLARVSTVVFDKTGTLTASRAASVEFSGPQLSEKEERWLFSVTRNSTHPHATCVGESIPRDRFYQPVQSFRETPGCGIEARVADREILIGAAAWLESRGVLCRRPNDEVDRMANKNSFLHVASRGGSAVHVAIDGKYRGRFVLAGALRPQIAQLLGRLSPDYELALLSGDNASEQERFRGFFGPSASLRFNQSPSDKLDFIRRLQTAGKTVMMIGDGLNDAGALRQSDVGVAVVENVSAFSPASDVIMEANRVPRLHEVLRYSRAAVRIVRLSLLISAIYNVIGVSIAARGLLSPVLCAILMPLSSVSVVVFACGMTTWLARRIFGGTGDRREQAGSIRSEVISPRLETNANVIALAAMGKEPAL